MVQRSSKSRAIVTAVAALIVLFLLFVERPSQNRAAGAQQDGALFVATPRAATEINIPTDQIIVKFAVSMLSQADQARQLDRLSQAAGMPLELVRPMSGDAYVYGLPEPLPAGEVSAISAALDSDPAVLYAEPDRIMQAIGRTAASLFAPANADRRPDDTYYSNQWNFHYSAGTDEGVNLPPAWDITTGNPSVVVGVIDTGILNHEDLAGRTVPGYDFIHDPAVANDGNGRDPDPSDPGDWEPAGACYSGSPAFDSSWHGTHVAGTIGAATNNDMGVAGVNWQARILPVRVLGRCGGYLSDVLDGARWAAGIPVPGAPINNNPAKVINLSLGGAGQCENAEQAAFDDIANRGTMVVVAAGNHGKDAAGYSPGNCKRVVTVAATDRGGDLASYSNFGGAIEISAPGGDIGSSGVLSTSNNGDTVPAQNGYAYYAGTSMAAPHVAGVASLLMGQKPNMSPGQVLDRLQDTARPFPGGSGCSTAKCGAGIVDAGAAVFEDNGPPPTPTSTPTPQLAAPAISDIVNSDGDGNFVVVWSAVPKAQEYKVDQKRNSQSWQLVYEGPGTSLKRIDLPNGEYCYRVRAVNPQIASAWSEIKCTIAGPAPATPTATPRPKPGKIIFLPLV